MPNGQIAAYNLQFAQILAGCGHQATGRPAGLDAADRKQNKQGFKGLPICPGAAPAARPVTE
jgi:hypothetical protein